jgi:hypothetical protein
VVRSELRTRREKREEKRITERAAHAESTPIAERGRHAEQGCGAVNSVERIASAEGASGSECETGRRDGYAEQNRPAVDVAQAL